jgi:hypothetical protein
MVQPFSMYERRPTTAWSITLSFTVQPWLMMASVTVQRSTCAGEGVGEQCGMQCGGASEWAAQRRSCNNKEEGAAGGLGGLGGLGMVWQGGCCRLGWSVETQHGLLPSGAPLTLAGGRKRGEV